MHPPHRRSGGTPATTPEQLPRQATSPPQEALASSAAPSVPAVPPVGGTVYEDGLLRVTRTVRPPGLCLAGDVDASNVTRLAHLLSQEAGALRRPVPLAVAPIGGGVPVAAVRPGRPVALHLDLSGLDFVDVSGMRLFVHTALAMFEDGGRRLVLHGLAAHLRRVMEVVGWDRTPGLDIAPESPRSGAVPC